MPSGLPIATTSWPTLRPSEWPIGAVGRPGLVDLHDGEVGEGVDAVDGARELAAVLELDRELVGARDDVAVGQDPAVRVVDHARADALRRLRERVGAAGALGVDLDDRRPDLGRGVDDRRRLVDGDRELGAGLLRGAELGHRGRMVERAGPLEHGHRPAGGEHRRQHGHRDDRAEAGTAAAAAACRSPPPSRMGPGAPRRVPATPRRGRAGPGCPRRRWHRSSPPCPRRRPCRPRRSPSGRRRRARASRWPGSATGSGRPARWSAPTPTGRRAGGPASGRSGAPRRAASPRADRGRRRPGERPPRDRRS